MTETKKICFIEDENDIADAVKTYLENFDYQVQTFGSAEDFHLKKSEDFSGVYLVDWNLPGEPGIEVIKKIREDDKISPIFIVSAYTQKDEIIEGLRSGADDYITKPFSFEELLARVDNACAKYQIVLEKAALENFKLLPEANAFIKEGKTVNLTSREFIIFEYLVEKSGSPVTREELIERFSKEEKMTSRNIDVHVFSLRKKLKLVSMFIETVWGKGYKLT